MMRVPAREAITAWEHTLPGWDQAIITVAATMAPTPGRSSSSGAAINFYTVEMTIAGRESMEPTLVANAVQRNADPYYYEPFWEPAGAIVQALGGIKEQAAAAGIAGPAQSDYALGPVQPQTATVANTVGPMFGIKTVGGYRDPATAQPDPNGHPAGLALDFMINDIANGKTAADRLAKYLQDNAADLGVKYIIWQQHIWSVERSDEGWRAIPDRGSPTQNHMDHVHLSLTGNPVTKLRCDVLTNPVGAERTIESDGSVIGRARVEQRVPKSRQREILGALLGEEVALPMHLSRRRKRGSRCGSR